MDPKHIEQLRSLNAAYKTAAGLERNLMALLSGRLGIDVGVVNQASDGLCIDIDDGFKGLTPLTEDTLAEILSLPRKDAIQYIRDRSI